MDTPKYEIGQEVTFEGRRYVITGIGMQDCHNGSFTKGERVRTIPQPGNTADKKERKEIQEPVIERTLGYYIQDPNQRWLKKYSTWARESEVKA